jgi:hypothetical protein
LPFASTVMYCLATSTKATRTEISKTVSQNKHSLIISLSSQVLCYSKGKLANTIHVIECICNFSFWFMCSVLLNKYTIICSLILNDGYLDCFRFLPLMYKTIKNILVQVFHFICSIFF